MRGEIPLFKIYWDDEDIRSVSRVIKRGSHWAVGPEVRKFEEMLCGYLGSRFCVTFNSGTSALHAALLAHKIGPGDEVIVPSFTFVATANAPLFVGAKPVFADIEEETLGLDPDDVLEKIGPNTRAIIAVHYAGLPCRVGDLREIAQDYGLLLIEDAAEAFGAEYKGSKVGTIGHSGILSFCQNKIITTGEGGAVVTDSEELYRRLRLIRSHGRRDDDGYFDSVDSADYVSLGYNLRLSSILAALGISQLRKVDRLIQLRRDRAERYNSALSGVPEVRTPREPEGSLHVYQLYTIRTPGNQRDQLLRYLAQHGIMSKVYFDPIHLTSFYRENFGYEGGELPVTEYVSKEVLSLPMFPTLREEDILFIAEKIREFFEGV